MDELSFLTDLAVKSSLVLGGIFLLLACLRRASAAERHLVLLLGTIVVLLLPVGMLACPRIFWTVTFPVVEKPHEMVEIQSRPMGVPPSEPPQLVSNAPAPAEPILTLSNFMLIALASGALAQGLLIAQAARFWGRIRRRAIPADLSPIMLAQARVFAGPGELPAILVSSEISVPVLAGWLKPSVILPISAMDSPTETQLMMLCHELAHYRRGDSRLLPLLALARIFYWWQPLAWLALARLRREREAACDDFVITQNFRASDYAGLIVTAARALESSPSITRASLAMATSSSVGDRVAAVLDPALRRHPLGHLVTCAALISAAIIGWLLAATDIRAADRDIDSHAEAGTGSTERRIELEFKFLRIDEKTYADRRSEVDGDIERDDLGALINLGEHLPAVSFIAAPSVTTQENLKANVEILKSVHYATAFNEDKNGAVIPSGFRDRSVGVSVDALPRLAGDGTTVDLKYKCEVTTFGGWMPTENRLGKEPVFNIRRREQEGVLIGPKGIAVWIGDDPSQNRSIDPDHPDKEWIFPDEQSPRRNLLLIQARPVPLAPKSAGRQTSEGMLIRTALKVFQISEKSYALHPAEIEAAIQDGDITYLSKIRDFALLSAPTATVKPDEQIKMEATHKMELFPSAANGIEKVPAAPPRTRDVGFSVVEKASVVDGGIDLTLYPRLTRFEGMIKTSSGEVMPVFNTRSIAMKVLIPDGESHGFWLAQNIPDAEAATGRDSALVRMSSAPSIRVGIVITAGLCTGDGRSMPLPQPRHSQIIEKLNTIAIREFKAQQKDVADVITSLAIECKNADPDHQGVPFVLNLAKPRPKVDLDFENASPRQILDSIAKQTGLSYSIDDYAVYLRPPPQEPQVPGAVVSPAQPPALKESSP